MRLSFPLWFVLVAVGIGIADSPRTVLSAEPTPQPAVKWEYRIVSKDQLLELGKKDLVAGLNKLGDEGWELTAVEPAYIFKRPKLTAKQIEDLKRRVLQAQADVEGWKDRVAWSERMVKKGYMTERQLEADRSLLQAAEIVLDKARQELKALPTEPKPEK